MDKKALVEKLQKEGYNVTLEGNVPMFVLTETLSLEKIKELLKKNDYVASFGYRKVAGSSDKVTKASKKTSAQPENEKDRLKVADMDQEKEEAVLVEETNVEHIEDTSEWMLGMSDFQAENDGQYSLF